MKAQAVSGETKKRELARILAAYERGDIDVLVNAQLLAEGWNSPRATVCMHLAPTASKRIYQQRVGRVTRRQPGKEAGIVVDFVHPATKHDDPVVTLHSLLDRDVYRGGAIVVGPVRRGRGRRLRVERRVVPVTADENRRIEVFERELWRIAVEHLDYGEQVQWAALAGARVAPAGWRRARAMLHFDEGGELKRAFLLTAVERNKNPQLRIRALQEIAASRDAEAFDRAIEMIAGWPRDEKREGVKVVLQALAEKKIGRRDQANNWIWACAEMTREVHEEYAVQRWPETKRLLGLLVNSSGGAHARNARRLVHAARQQDRRLAAALLAAALPHTAEAGEVINGARTRMSRKPAALARELLRNFPKGKGRRGQRRRKKGKGGESQQPVEAMAAASTVEEGVRGERRRQRRGRAPRRATKRDADPDRRGRGGRGAQIARTRARPRRRSRSRSARRAGGRRRSSARGGPVRRDRRSRPGRARRGREAEARCAQAGAEDRLRARGAAETAGCRGGAEAEARRRASGRRSRPSVAERRPRPRRAEAQAGSAPPRGEAEGQRGQRGPDRARARVGAGPRGRRGRARATKPPDPPRMSPRPRSARSRRHSCPSAAEVDLARRERGHRRASVRTSSAAVGVDPVGDALAPVPASPSPRAARRAPAGRPGPRRAARPAAAPAPPAAPPAPPRRRRGRASAASGRSGGAADTLTPIPTTAQPSCGRPSTSTPATLRPSTCTSFGHFTRAAVARDVGDREPGAERQQRVELAQDQRAQQRGARRRLPAPALPPAAGGLHAGGHERAVGRAGGRRARGRGGWSSRSRGGAAAGGRARSRRVQADLVAGREAAQLSRPPRRR